MFVRKYHNKKTVVQGIKFDSKKEANRFLELQMLEKAGEISQLERQVKFELIPKQKGERSCSYIADFVYRTKDGEQIVEDTKGYRTPEYKIKRKLMLFKYNIAIKEVWAIGKTF